MNIFARELKALLEEHGKSLGSLYSFHSDLYKISPSKVERLKRSLEIDITATINSDEIALVADSLELAPDGAEIRRLRAALLAESVRHLLGGRMDRDQALALGEIAFRLLQNQEPEKLLALRDELLEGIRGGAEESQADNAVNNTTAEVQPPDPAAAQIEQALEPAVKTYEEGALWLEVARETRERSTRLGYLAQARALLERAKSLATHAPTITIGTAQQQEWLAIIEEALTEAMSLR